MSLLPRVDVKPTLSTTFVIGICLIATTTFALAITLLVHYFCKSRRVAKPIECATAVEKGLSSAEHVSPNTSAPHIWTKLCISKPMPPVPAARPCPLKPIFPETHLPPNGHFAPHSVPAAPARTFRPIPISLISTSSPDANSTAFPSRRGSLSSLSSGTTLTSPEQLKVHHIFTPRLPDELVLLRGEQVSLLQAFDDGWYLIGRRRLWASKNKPKDGHTQYVFGHPTTLNRVYDEVELGVAPAWVFKRDSPQAHESPSRAASLGVTLPLMEDGLLERDHVMSWSNFL